MELPSEFMAVDEPNGLAARFVPADKTSLPPGLRDNWCCRKRASRRSTTIRICFRWRVAAMYLDDCNNELWPPTAFKDFSDNVAGFRTATTRGFPTPCCRCPAGSSYSRRLRDR